MNAIDYYNKYLRVFSASAFVGMTPQEPKVIDILERQSP